MKIYKKFEEFIEKDIDQEENDPNNKLEQEEKKQKQQKNKTKKVIKLPNWNKY